MALASRLATEAITVYADLVEAAMQRHPIPSSSGGGGNEAAYLQEARRAQLTYHTIYFFQVLTLDRGTPTGYWPTTRTTSAR